MANVVNDPEELRNFAHALTQFNDTLENATGQINGLFSQLELSWNDRKKEQFKDGFLELIHNLAKFREVSAESVNHLRNMAGILDQYNNS